MKKIALFLTLIIVLCMFPVNSSALNVIPVSAEITQTTDDELKITVYLENVKNLVSFRGVVEYDTSYYTLKSAKPSTHTDSYGDERENLNGMWVFGNLYDGTGSVGAFVSVDGATKTLRIPVCEFVLISENGECNPEDIVFCICEVITDDADEKNDIRIKTRIPFNTPQVDMSGFFGYETNGETIKITEFKTYDDVVFVPEFIEGVTVRSLVGKTKCNNPFVVFNRNVLCVNDGFFSENNMIIAPFQSAPVASAKKSGGKYIAYYENVKPHLSERVLYTNTFLVTDCKELFVSNSDFQATPSHFAAEKYFGTGSVISLGIGNKTADFQLCVKGDVNGDSVCDVLDIALSELFMNDLCNLRDIQQKSTDMNEDSDINPQDYTQLVNLALGSEYSLFDGVRGDLNGDNCVDVLDAVSFYKMMNNNNNLSPEEIEKADFNNNGIIDANDMYILSEVIKMFE